MSKTEIYDNITIEDYMKSNVLLKRGGFCLGIYLLAAAILLISSGSLLFWKAWLFLALSFIPLLFFFIFLSFQKTRILEINIDFGSIFKANIKKIIFISVMIILALVAAGLNFRFKLSLLPTWIIVQFSIIFVFALLLFINTCREYKILSRHLFEHRRKKLIDQGPYSIVRHPMYSSLILMSLSGPLVLGSMLAFVICLVLSVYMIVKMLKEEKTLPEEIRDYSEYKERVKYKMIPYIW